MKVLLKITLPSSPELSSSFQQFWFDFSSSSENDTDISLRVALERGMSLIWILLSI